MAIDLVSEEIVGFAVLMEGPNWRGAMAALECTTRNKRLLCEEYGIRIEDADWPAHHVAHAVTFDRAELFVQAGQRIVTILHIQFDTTPPWRPDWKAIVERRFRALNDVTVAWLPGHVYHPRSRGEKDYRLDAVLTPFEFRQILISHILLHNQTHVVPGRYLPEDLHAADIEQTPNSIWQWGILNRHGLLREMDQDAMRLALLRESKGTVQPDGIHVDGLRYTCDQAVQEDWFVRSTSAAGTSRRGRGAPRREVPILIDPRTRRYTYLVRDESTSVREKRLLEPCILTPADARFGEFDWYELDAFQMRERYKVAQGEEKRLRHKINHDALVETIVERATQATAAARADVGSRRDVLGDMRERRQEYAAYERELDARPLIASASSELSTRPTRVSDPSARPGPTHLDPVLAPSDAAKRRRLQLLSDANDPGGN